MKRRACLVAILLSAGCSNKIGDYVARHRAEIATLRDRVTSIRSAVAAAKTVADDPGCRPPTPLAYQRSGDFATGNVKVVSYGALLDLGAAKEQPQSPMEAAFRQESSSDLYFLWKGSSPEAAGGPDLKLQDDLRAGFDHLLAARYLLVGRAGAFQYGEKGYLDLFLGDLSTGKIVCAARVEKVLPVDPAQEGFTTVLVNRATGARSGTGVTYGGWANGMRDALTHDAKSLAANRWGLKI